MEEKLRKVERERDDFQDLAEFYKMQLENSISRALRLEKELATAKQDRGVDYHHNV